MSAEALLELLELAEKFAAEHPDAHLCFFESWLEAQEESDEQPDGDSDE
jgi:ABC-type nitrate/sulfonate/bicarbonate transport system substrate-binding protein